MESLAASFVLGIVEGLTEFLPVSSSGHLVLASHALGLAGERAATFDVVIQTGAIFAVVLLYWERFTGLVLPKRRSSLSGLRGLLLLALTTFPGALLGLLLHGQIKALFRPLPVVLALVSGALFMLAAERWLASRHERSETQLDRVTPMQALGIGCFQCLALWPGFSRSASTIVGGMFLGLSRRSAAEYSFIAAVPIIMGAAGYDIIKSLSVFTAGDIPFFIVGSAAAFASAVFAIKVFIRLLAHVTLVPFALYRMALAIPVYWLMAS
ncbi:MAG: undecaprenyl-diphosphate phosphatase [Mailhella sp.]|nr:undecaprenyl-diphosphate phosphatase [Mailhella sp.]